MKKNKFIIFVSCLTVSFYAVNIASAQWSLPDPNIFSLSKYVDAAIWSVKGVGPDSLKFVEREKGEI